MQIPEAITAYVKIKQSFHRMEELLECDEMAPVDTETLGVAKDGETTLSIVNGTFVWDLEKTAEQLEKEKKKKEDDKKIKEKEDLKKAKDDAKKNKAEDESDPARSVPALCQHSLPAQNVSKASALVHPDILIITPDSIICFVLTCRS